jgi:queuine tRNA-ribosyltransferase
MDAVITENGARFRSYVDQREHLLSPERSIEMQSVIGSARSFGREKIW